MNKKWLLIIMLPIFIGSFFLYKKTPDFSLPETIAPNSSNFNDSIIKSSEEKCEESFLFYEENLNSKKTKLRFENLHLKIEEKVWRLRFFYDDGDEGEVPTYQVFLEDENEYTDLIESTKNSPGEKYKELQSMESELIYEEHGYLNEETDEFIHTENKRILKVISEKVECTRN